MSEFTDEEIREIAESRDAAFGSSSATLMLPGAMRDYIERAIRPDYLNAGRHITAAVKTAAAIRARKQQPARLLPPPAVMPWTVTIPPMDPEVVKRYRDIIVAMGGNWTVGVDYQRDSAHRPLPIVNERVYPSTKAPHPPEHPVDALLRFCLGQPNGERWMGKAAWGNVQMLARAHHPEGNGTARLPVRSSLIYLLDAIDGASSHRWLSAADGREFMRLCSIVRNQVRS